MIRLLLLHQRQAEKAAILDAELAAYEADLVS